MYKEYQIDKSETSSLKRDIVKEINMKLVAIKKLTTAKEDLEFLCELSADLSDLHTKFK